MIYGFFPVGQDIFQCSRITATEEETEFFASIRTSYPGPFVSRKSSSNFFLSNPCFLRRS